MKQIQTIIFQKILKLNEKNEYNTPFSNIEDIKKILDNDKPEGDTTLEELDGLVHFDKVTDSVELKKGII